MKKYSLFLILVLLITTIIADETVPRIRIEGSEIENLNINETQNKTIKLSEPELEHEKIVLQKKKENIIEKNHNYYKLYLALGNNIFGNFQAELGLYLRNNFISPNFSYYHNYPFSKRYEEIFEGKIPCSINFKKTRINISLFDQYKTFQYELQDFLNTNRFKTDVKFEYLVNSDIFIVFHSLYFLQFFSTNSDFLKSDNLNNKFQGKIFLEHFKIDFYADLNICKTTDYNVGLKLSKPFNKGNISLGIAGYSLLKKGLFPLLNFEYEMSKIILFLKSNIQIDEINLLPIKFLYLNTDLYQLNKIYETGIKLDIFKLMLNISILYKEILKMPLYFKKLNYVDYTFGTNYPAFIVLKVSKYEPFTFNLTYLFNINKRLNIPRNAFSLFFQYNIDRIITSLRLQYYDLTNIQNGTIPAHIDFAFRLSYKINNVFSCGLGAQRDGTSIFANPQNTVFIFLRVLL